MKNQNLLSICVFSRTRTREKCLVALDPRGEEWIPKKRPILKQKLFWLIFMYLLK